LGHHERLFNFFILGGVLVPIPTDIGPKELQRRISACKPSCIVAGGGAIDKDLLDVIDQVTYFCYLKKRILSLARDLT